jgi:hypothetical protein
MHAYSERIVALALGTVLASMSLAQSVPSAAEPAATAVAGPDQAAPSKPATSAAAKSAAKPAAPVVQSGFMLPKPTAKEAAANAKSTAAAKRKQVTSPYKGMRLSEKAKDFYPAAWGVDKLRVSYTSSGNLIRFSYRVVEPKLSKALGDHESTPYLFAPRTHAMLQIPTMEKIGQLRQLGASEPNKEYWMVFSNKGNLVRPGERVNVIIGKFHADGLLVE